MIFVGVFRLRGEAVVAYAELNGITEDCEVIPHRKNGNQLAFVGNLCASQGVPEGGWSMAQTISWRLSTGRLLRNNQNCTDLPSGRWR